MFGMAQGLAGFAGSFADESGKIRDEEGKKAAADSQIEQKALEHLASADDPQIRAAAVTAMLTPKKAGAASGLQKWFGQQRDHPVFDEVHRLMTGSDGQPARQPFLSEEAKATGVASGRERGRLAGANSAYSDITGENLDNETLARMAQGSVGAPPAHVAAVKAGTLTLMDGTTVGGHMEPDGSFVDAAGNYRDDVTSWSPGAPKAGPDPNAHGQWISKPDPAHPGQFLKEWTTIAQGSSPTVGPPPPPLQVVQTPGGIVGVETRGGAPHTVPILGGGDVNKAEPPSTALNGLREREAVIEKRAQAAVPKIGGGVIPQDQKKLATARDREAQAAGFQNWADLQQQITAAQAGVAGAVPGQNAPPAALAPSAPSAPGTKPAPPKKGAKATAPSALDLQKILAELAKSP